MNHDHKPSTGKIITADAHDLPESIPSANEGMMRRDWLKNALMGGIGIGLFGIPLTSFADEGKGIDCPRITRVSKNVEAQIVQYTCKSCLCGKDRVYLIKLDFSGPVISNQVCDESLKLIPDKSIMKGSLSYTLRGGLCPDTKTPMLWGCHEGKIMLYAPTGKPLFEATLSGTEGVNSQATASKRCCWPYGEGALKACNICATYLLKVPFNFKDPCVKTPPASLYMQIDGSLMCPC
jgi:hypothetical protein